MKERRYVIVQTMNTTSAKATLIMVRTDEVGEHVDYTDPQNNHRITVIRMESGHVGIRFSPLPPREGYKYAPAQERVEYVTAYPLAGELPGISEALNIWESSKRD